MSKTTLATVLIVGFVFGLLSGIWNIEVWQEIVLFLVAFIGGAIYEHVSQGGEH